MGAWGTKPFENDGAGNFVAELSTFHPEDPGFLRDTLEMAEGGGYVEVDAGQAVIASAAVVAKMKGMDIEVPGPVREWVEKNSGYDASPLVPVALRALDVVTESASSSEIFELWAETGAFDEWKESVDRIYTFLQSARES